MTVFRRLFRSTARLFPARILVRSVAVAALAVGLAHGADSLAEIEAQTDKSDPEQVFTLAQWCTENGLKTKASKYYSLVVKLDKDHQGARDALGMVKVGEH